MDKIDRHKVLVTGSSGYIGSALVKLLLKQGHDVVLCSTSEGLGDFTLLTETELESIDTIVHLAGASKTTEKSDDYLKIIDLNVRSTRDLAAKAQNAGVKHFIFASTGLIYTSKQKALQNEEQTVEAYELYTQSKLRAEQELEKLADENFAVTVCRIANVYGIAPNTRPDLILNSLINSAIFEKKVVFRSDPALTISMVHVEDVALAIGKLVAEGGQTPFEVYNIVPPNEYYSLQQLGDIIVKDVGDVQVEFLNEKKASYMLMDGSKFLKHFPDFTYQWTLEKGVRSIKHSCLTANKTPDK